MVMKQLIQLTFILGIVLVLGTSANAESNLLPFGTAHFSFTDSVHHHGINIGAQLADSLSITNLEDAPTHYDNSASIAVFLNGHFTNRFHFNSRVKMVTDHTNKEIKDNFFNPDEGLPYVKQNEKKRTWDNFAANITYDLDVAKLLVGFDYIETGHARRNHVILRGDQNHFRPWQDSSSRIYDTAPTPYFGYGFELGPITYTQYNLKLFERKGYGKYMHIHSLDLSLPFDIQFGITESTVYGSTTEDYPNPNLDADSAGRDFEWAYAIPFIPYMFEEHLMGDRDNSAISFDLSIRTIPHWEFYGELLWDDMKTPTSMLDDSWWGNKWATSIGMARDSLSIGNTLWSWFVEYTRIEPWVYTHHKGGGYTYGHYSQCLGGDLGPNSQELYTELTGSYRVLGGFFRDALLQGSIHASAVAKDSAFGSDLYDIHTPQSPTNKKFLDENTTLHYIELGGKLEIRPLEYITIRAGYDRYFGDYEGYRAMAGASLQY